MEPRIVRHGALDVVQFVDPKNQLQRELKRLDDRLFLEKQVGFDGVPVWCVVVDVGLSEPPIAILEWRDERGNPIELSSGIVERVARMDRHSGRLVKGAIERNRQLTERKRAESRQAYRDIMEESKLSFLGKRSVNLRRGVHLRMARDKQRRQGRRV